MYRKTRDDFIYESIPEELSRKGLLEASQTEAFIYGQEALGLWGIFERFTTAYFANYYSDDQSVADDPVLKEFF